MASRRLLVIGACLGALAVAAGAFGAHGLKGRVSPEGLAWWHTGAQYHLIHAVAAVLAGLVCTLGGPWARRSGICFVSGTAIFSGTLYAMALGAPRWFGAITPIGGVLLIVGWVLLAVAGAKAGDA